MTENPSLPEKGKFLLRSGWTQKSMMTYHKDGIEIFFDNSNAVEIFRIGNDNDRLLDLYIVSIQDMEEMLTKIEEHHP